MQKSKRFLISTFLFIVSLALIVILLSLAENVFSINFTGSNRTVLSYFIGSSIVVSGFIFYKASRSFLLGDHGKLFNILKNNEGAWMSQDDLTAALGKDISESEATLLENLVNKEARRV